MNKKIISILVCFVLFLGAPVTASEEITVCLNGTPLEFDVPPQLINDRTMVPMRKIFEALGAAVDWNGEKSISHRSERRNCCSAHHWQQIHETE